MNKSKAILQIVDYFQSKYEAANITISDYWDADREAIGLTDKSGQYLAYISTIGNNDNNYYLALENPSNDNELPYSPGDCFDNLNLVELEEIVVRHLRLKNKSVNYITLVKSVLFGIATGDALGVPVEFRNREVIRQDPVTDMIGYGTYNLPAGTWSDDSALAFCLAEALTTKFDLNCIGQNFVSWYHNNYWTPRGSVFDIGIATRQAINRLAAGVQPDLAGGFDETSNGNGSLMRILPLLFYLLDKPVNSRYNIIKQVSSITHGHVRSVTACFYYLEFARHLLQGEDKTIIYKKLQVEIPGYLENLSINPAEINLFDRLLKKDITGIPEEEIYSSGYVLHTLEASIWCLMTTNSYKEAVLKAVNLGDDADTTGAVTGGLAGLLYGYNNIPSNWIKQIARQDDIEDLAERLANQLTYL